MPTATQLVAVTQERALRIASLRGVELETVDDVVPFDRSTRVFHTRARPVDARQKAARADSAPHE